MVSAQARAGLRESRRRSAAAVLMGLSVVFAIGCTHQPSVKGEREHALGTPAQKNDASSVRHDLEPLTKRFPAMGDPVSASWVSGNMGDSRVPGPSVYWIDAVVQLRPEAANRLRQEFAPQSTTKRPNVWASLTSELPQGPFLSSEALNSAFASQRVRAKVFLSENTPVVVLTAKGD